MKKKAILWILIGLILAGAVFLIYTVIQKNTIAMVTQEYEAHCTEALSDVYELRDCMEYGLSDLSIEIVDCTFCHDIVGTRYIVTLQVNCRSHMDLNNAEKRLLSYAVIKQIPERITTSTGKQVTIWDNSTDTDYKGKLVYVSVNDQLILKPEGITQGSDVIYCPNCGTSWNANHPAGKNVRKTGRCSWCPD